MDIYKHPSSLIPFQPKYSSSKTVPVELFRNPLDIICIPSSCIKLPSKFNNFRDVFVAKNVPSSTSQISLCAKFIISIPVPVPVPVVALLLTLSRKECKTLDAPREPIKFLDRSNSFNVDVDLKY